MIYYRFRYWGTMRNIFFNSKGELINFLKNHLINNDTIKGTLFIKDLNAEKIKWNRIEYTDLNIDLKEIKEEIELSSRKVKMAGFIS